MFIVHFGCLENVFIVKNTQNSSIIFMLHNLIYLSEEFVNWKCGLRISLASISIYNLILYCNSHWKCLKGKWKTIQHKCSTTIRVPFSWVFISFRFVYYCKVFKDISSIFQEWKRMFFFLLWIFDEMTQQWGWSSVVVKRRNSNKTVGGTEGR